MNCVNIFRLHRIRNDYVQGHTVHDVQPAPPSVTAWHRKSIIAGMAARLARQTA